MKAKVAIVLVNYNGWKDTIECLESLLNLDYPNYQIIVVDNNSANDSVAKIKEWAGGLLNIGFEYQPLNSKLKELVYPLTAKPINLAIVHDTAIEEARDLKQIITLIISSENRGFAGGNNLGIRLALKNQAEYVWLLNNDTIVPKNTLTLLVNEFGNQIKNKGNLGILGSKLFYYHEPDKIQAIIGEYKPLFGVGAHIGQDELDHGQFKNFKILDRHYIVGAAMFVSKEFILEVGPMAEDYFLYYEEIDWVNRGHKKGYNIDICEGAVVYHKEGASVGNFRNNDNKSFLSDFYSIRNRILVTKRYYRKYLIPVYSSMILIILNRVKRKQFDRILPIVKVFFRSLTQS